MLDMLIIIRMRGVRTLYGYVYPTPHLLLRASAKEWWYSLAASLLSLMASSSGFKCICCGKLVLKSESRRKVGGPSSKIALSAYLDLCRVVVPGLSIVPPDLSEKTKLFWCVLCFSKLERVKKVIADLQKLENELKGNILCVNSTLLNVPVTSQRSTVTNITTPTRRGPSSAHDLAQPSPKRRRQYSSPKRQILARTVVTGTPSVSVSNILQLSQISDSILH